MCVCGGGGGGGLPTHVRDAGSNFEILTTLVAASLVKTTRPKIAQTPANEELGANEIKQ